MPVHETLTRMNARTQGCEGAGHGIDKRESGSSSGSVRGARARRMRDDVPCAFAAGAGGELLLMHRDHDVFVRAMAARKKVVLTFLEGDSEATRTTVCGPVFYTPAAGEGEEWCYYVWDFQQKAGKHLLVLLSGRIVSIKPSDEYFERSGFTIHDGSSDSARQSS